MRLESCVEVLWVCNGLLACAVWSKGGVGKLVDMYPGSYNKCFAHSSRQASKQGECSKLVAYIWLRTGRYIVK